MIPIYVEKLIDSGRGTAGAFDAWAAVREECQLFINRLKSVRPLVIDYFLAWNESLRSIGNLMIAAAILECEAIWLKEQTNQNRRLAYQSTPIRSSPDEIRCFDI
jgi:hypothetical protein